MSSEVALARWGPRGRILPSIPDQQEARFNTSTASGNCRVAAAMVIIDIRNHYGLGNGMQSVTPTVPYTMSLCSELATGVAARRQFFYHARSYGLRVNIVLPLPKLLKLEIFASDSHRRGCPSSTSYLQASLHHYNGLLHHRIEVHSTDIWAAQNAGSQ